MERPLHARNMNARAPASVPIELGSNLIGGRVAELPDEGVDLGLCDAGGRTTAFAICGELQSTSLTTNPPLDARFPDSKTSRNRRVAPIALLVRCNDTLSQFQRMRFSHAPDQITTGSRLQEILDQPRRALGLGPRRAAFPCHPTTSELPRKETATRRPRDGPVSHDAGADRCAWDEREAGAPHRRWSRAFPGGGALDEEEAGEVVSRRRPMPYEVLNCNNGLPRGHRPSSGSNHCLWVKGRRDGYEVGETGSPGFPRSTRP
jgi:hypothetical protein